MHIIEYYSEIRMNGLLTNTPSWLNLKGMMLNEIRQSQEVKYGMILFMLHYQNDKSIVREKKPVNTRA